MNKNGFQVSINVDQLINQLTPGQQQILAEKLWAIRVERLSQKMRKAAVKNKVTQKDIEKMCEDARRKVYEKYRH